jgi:hypothetical protein
MQIRSAYCAIRDRNVCVAMTDEQIREGQADLPDLKIICMKYSYGSICTGDFCPNYGTWRVGMGAGPAPNCPTA